MVSTVVFCSCLGLLFAASSSAFTIMISSAEITHAQFSGLRIPTPVVDSIDLDGSRGHDPGWIPLVKNINNYLDGKSWCKTRRQKDKLTHFLIIFCATQGATVLPKLSYTPRIENEIFYGKQTEIFVVVILFFKGFWHKNDIFHTQNPLLEIRINPIKL